jgi:hypothetical protein
MGDPRYDNQSVAPMILNSGSMKVNNIFNILIGPGPSVLPFLTDRWL